MKTIRLGVTSCPKTPQYISWLRYGEKFGYRIECIELHFEGKPHDELLEENLDALDTLDAIVFTGGEDVEPHRFGMQLSDADLAHLEVISVPERDEMEWALAQASLAQRLPILGICRGMQLLNAVMGGTLHLDIEKQAVSTVTHKKISQEHSRYHTVTLDKPSLLHELTGAVSAEHVSSRHHQAVAKLGDGLKPVGFSPDGIIEAMESSLSEQILLLVQWHPERMWLEAQSMQRPELNNAFSENLLRGFLYLIAEHKSQPIA